MSDSSRPHGLQPTRLPHPWDFPGKSTGVGCHHLLRQVSLLEEKCNTLWAPQWHFKGEARRSLIHQGAAYLVNDPGKGSEVVQSCLTLCDPVDCSPPGSSVHGILQARILGVLTKILLLHQQERHPGKSLNYLYHQLSVHLHNLKRMCWKYRVKQWLKYTGLMILQKLNTYVYSHLGILKISRFNRF